MSRQISHIKQQRRSESQFALAPSHGDRFQACTPLANRAVCLESILEGLAAVIPSLQLTEKNINFIVTSFNEISTGQNKEIGDLLRLKALHVALQCNLPPEKALPLILPLLRRINEEDFPFACYSIIGDILHELAKHIPNLTDGEQIINEISSSEDLRYLFEKAIDGPVPTLVSGILQVFSVLAQAENQDPLIDAVNIIAESDLDLLIETAEPWNKKALDALKEMYCALKLARDLDQSYREVFDFIVNPIESAELPLPPAPFPANHIPEGSLPIAFDVFMYCAPAICTKWFRA
jgi:hypothetical protein